MYILIKRKQAYSQIKKTSEQKITKDQRERKHYMMTKGLKYHEAIAILNGCVPNVSAPKNYETKTGRLERRNR